MERLFRITGSHIAERVPTLPATSETLHLHRLIEGNLDLLPGDQIDPDDPVRWLLIRSEMPIDDPESGKQRWSLDLLLADHRAKPALVECKLSLNAEIRKEMIGQAIEYAANAQHYWDAESLKRHAEASHGGREVLDRKIKALGWADGTDDFFEALIKNLKEGFFRLVFAVDSAPYRLRSTVEFLNQELQDIEALLVEIQRYQVGGETVAVSRVFGYTDRIRSAKREAEARKFTPQSDSTFKANLLTRLGAEVAEAIFAFVDNAVATQWIVRPGRTGNLVFYNERAGRLALVSISKNGDLIWNIASFDRDFPGIAADLKALAGEVGSTGTLGYPSSSAQLWVPRAGFVLEGLSRIVLSI